MALLNRLTLNAWTDELCRRLGEDPKKVVSIALLVKPGASVMVNIQKVITREDGVFDTEMLDYLAFVKQETVEDTHK